MHTGLQRANNALINYSMSINWASFRERSRVTPTRTQPKLLGVLFDQRKQQLLDEILTQAEKRGGAGGGRGRRRGAPTMLQNMDPRRPPESVQLGTSRRDPASGVLASRRADRRAHTDIALRRSTNATSRNQRPRDTGFLWPLLESSKD